MTITPRLWFATFTALVFVTGLSAGVLVDRTVLGQPDRAGMDGDGRGGGPIGLYGPLGPPAERFVSDLDRDLELTSAQHDAILTILGERQPEIRSLQEASREQFVTAQRALFAAISEVLTADQTAAFETLTSRQRDGNLGRRR